MSTPKPNEPPTDLARAAFIRNALAGVEKARRVQRVKQIVVTVLAFAAAFWLAFQAPGPELNVTGSVIILALGLAVCTAKIMYLVNKNTQTILQAIAGLETDLSSQR